MCNCADILNCSKIKKFYQTIKNFISKVLQFLKLRILFKDAPILFFFFYCINILRLQKICNSYNLILRILKFLQENFIQMLQFYFFFFLMYLHFTTPKLEIYNP